MDEDNPKFSTKKPTIDENEENNGNKSNDKYEFTKDFTLKRDMLARLEGMASRGGEPNRQRIEEILTSKCGISEKSDVYIICDEIIEKNPKNDNNQNQDNKLKELVTGILSNVGIFIFSLVYGIFSYLDENVSDSGKNSREIWIVRTFWIPPFFSILLWIIIDSPRICHYKITACVKPLRTCLIEYILAYACCLGCTERPETEVIAKPLSARRAILSVVSYTVEGLVVGILGIKSVAIATYLLVFAVLEIGTFGYELVSMGRYPWSKEAQDLVHRAVELTADPREKKPLITSEPKKIEINVENAISDDDL